jgi:DNA-binding transcriptional LysR family regulator
MFLAKQPHVSIEFRRVVDLDTLGEVGAGTIDIGATTMERVPAPLSSVQVPALSAGFCVLLPTRHPFASRREVPMTMLQSARLITLAGVPPPPAVPTDAVSDSALLTGSFLIIPGVDSLKQAVVNGLGIGIVPRAIISRLRGHPGLVVIPLSAARAAGALTLVYRDNDGQPNAVDDFVDAVRSSGQDRVSRKTPIALRASR